MAKTSVSENSVAPMTQCRGIAATLDIERDAAIFDYAVRLLVSSVTEAVFLPSSALAIRPAIASDALRSGSLSRCA
jgi:hypothetical protein